MTEFTTTSLIEFLLKFPKDLPIETELACMWNYPEEILEKMEDMSAEEFREFSMNKATDLCIFEGSWEKGNVSNVDGKFEKFQKIIEGGKP
ncbi:MAG: hypothetical protein J6M91_01655 [Methanobrevibacter sp.]|nr:hypothetical protein [Methanobrevibacter sp.]